MKIYALGDEDLGIPILSLIIFNCVGIAIICYFLEQWKSWENLLKRLGHPSKVPRKPPEVVRCCSACPSDSYFIIRVKGSEVRFGLVHLPESNTSIGECKTRMHGGIDTRKI